MSYASEVLADTPVAYYRMSEASGLIQDSSGGGRHANTAFGTAVYQQTGPIASDPSDKAILFDGDSGFSVPHSAGLNLGDVFTIEFWAKLNSTSQNHWFIDKGGNGSAATSAYRILVDHSAGEWALLSHATVIDVASTTVALTTAWSHFAVTKNGATVKQYLDGVDVTGSVNSTTFGNTSNDLKIGTNFVVDAFALAYMDEVALYPTALSQARVQAHYAAASAAEKQSYYATRRRTVGR